MTDLPESAAAAAPAADPIYVRLLPGDRFPTLHQPYGDDAGFAFDTLAGRYQLYAFFLSVDDPAIRQAIDTAMARGDLFDHRRAVFVGVSTTPVDRDVLGLTNAGPGVRFAWDFDRQMSKACGAVPLDAAPRGTTAVSRKWILVDPSLHVLQVWSMRDTPIDEVIAAIEALPPPDDFGGLSRPAPVLVLPNVLEPELCRSLVELHERDGGREIGFFRDGKQILDPAHKRRRDVTIADPDLREALTRRVGRRIAPEIERLFFMRADYLERHLIGCYSAADGGHFRPHIDNGPPTTHRRFAISINLNADFEGGEIVFPEYNSHGYKAPPGWAVVFPCAILHAVRPVTAGARYAYLPFLYDEAGRMILEGQKAAPPS